MTQLTDKMEGLRRKENALEDQSVCDSLYREQQQNIGFNQGVDASIALAEAAVVGDWEAEFDEQFVEDDEDDEDGVHIYEPGDVNGIKQFITSLLDAKDREITEAYKKGFIDGGLSN